MGNFFVYSVESNTSSTKNETEILMTSEGYILAAVTLFFIGLFGFAFNLFVIVLMWRDKQLWTPLNTILFNLVCSDFSVSILGNPWTMASAASGGWIFSRTVCKLYGFFMSLLGITSITTLTVLAFERYIMVSQPFGNCKLTRKRGLIMIILIWSYSFSLTLPPLIGWGDYVSEAANISCSVNWEDQTYNAMSYIVFLFVFGLAIPVIVIVFSYINILLTVKKKTIRGGKVTKAEGKLTLMILFMIIAFLAAWTPYAVMALIVQFGNRNIITPALAVIPALIAKSSICYNPIIYVGMNTQFRQSWKGTAEKRDRTDKQTLGTNMTETQGKSAFQKNGELSVETGLTTESVELKVVDGKIKSKDNI